VVILWSESRTAHRFLSDQNIKKLAEKNGKYLISKGYAYHLITDLNNDSIAWRALIAANKLIPMIA
jgi:hypothetical protein